MSPKISFRLKGKGEPKDIMMHVNCGIKLRDSLSGKVKYQPVILSAQTKIESKNWDNDSGRPLKSYHRKDGRINIKLNKYESTALDAIEALRLKDETITKDSLKDEIVTRLSSVRGTVGQKVRTNFKNYIENNLENNTYNVNTLKGHNSFLKKVEDFEELKGPLYIEELSKEQIQSFFYDFLIKRREYTDNSLAKIRGRFSTFLSKASNDGIKVGCSIEEADIKFQRYTPDEVYLNLQELNTLINHKCETNYKERAKDMFLVLSFTGQRIGEYPLFFKNEIKRENIGGVDVEYIKLVPPELNNKKKITVVPLLRPVKDIIQKWNGFPQSVPEAKLNSLIKNICEDAGIDSTEEVVRNVNNRKTKVESKMKFQRVKSHTGRRSYITNFLDIGVPDNCISRVTGHKSNYRASKAFGTYNKITDVENAARFIKELEFLCNLPKTEIPMQLV